MNDERAQHYFVPAASIVGKLRVVRQTAREISLAAKNAKAIAARAGTKADGFRPITDFIDELGNETRVLVEDIERTALRMSHEAVKTHRAYESWTRMRTAEQLAEHQHEAIAVLVKNAAEHFAESERAMLSSSDKLMELLDAIRLQVRAARVISTRSRVEAIRAEEHGVSLNVVSETVETAADRIRNSVGECIDCLRAV